MHSIVVAMAALLLPVAVEADVGRDWVKLGEKTVERRAEKDEIVVTAREGRFSKRKLKVRVAGVNIKDLKVQDAGAGSGSCRDVHEDGMSVVDGSSAVGASQ